MNEGFMCDSLDVQVTDFESDRPNAITIDSNDDVSR